MPASPWLALRQAQEAVAAGRPDGLGRPQQRAEPGGVHEAHPRQVDDEVHRATGRREFRFMKGPLFANIVLAD